jgi:hypothetical protein
MTRLLMDRSLITRICAGDAEAMDFLANHWSPYVHEIDDIMDGDRPNPRDQLMTFARACVLFSHPFYLKHLAALRQLVLNITVAYADSVDWEQPTAQPWQQSWADHHRHCGLEMVVAVATICGGHEHGFAISQEQRSLCHVDHHNREGKPI